MLIRTPAANGTGDYSPMRRKSINETADAVRVWGRGGSEPERRGHCFGRYADDCNGSVRGQEAVERVMHLQRRCYDKLHLQINESMRAVVGVCGWSSA